MIKYDVIRIVMVDVDIVFVGLLEPLTNVGDYIHSYDGEVKPLGPRNDGEIPSEHELKNRITQQVNFFQ